ncbi:hypothetical protein CRG98_004551 [Punica granatum]|uniref:Uncharacterized protein n=1 Tax=Punica granatum TaxID=22663 RepID=A0A2I0L2Z0_PUNGR|nr:hypothetical protein CRG98_004551 [Punica granatum]
MRAPMLRGLGVSTFSGTLDGRIPIGLARPKEKPPGRDAGPNWSVGPNGPSFWAGPAKQELGRGPLTERRLGSEEDGGDGVAGGGSRPWTPQRRHERAREMALDTVDALPRFRPIWRKIVEIRDIGDPGPAGSRAAGERCPALLGLPESNFFF